MQMRLVELITGLSRVADLGFGLPPGEAARSAALAVVLSRSLDLPAEDLRAGIYTALLMHVGCIGYAHETARAFDDELVMTAAAARTDLASPWDVATTLLPALVRGRPPLTKARLVATAAVRGRRHGRAFDTVACEVGSRAARRLQLPQAVQRSIYHAYEWWNGRGVPDGLGRDRIPLGARLAALTTTAMVFHTAGGTDVAVAAVARQRGSVLDPDLVDHFHADAERLLREVARGDPGQLVLEAEPPPVAAVSGPQLVGVASVFGDVADLKSPFLHGHSRRVAALAREAGRTLGLAATKLDDLELAGHLHDLGRVAVPAAVWEKPGKLDAHEWEQVRLHAYHSERILAGSPILAPLVELVGLHHERCDGSGYHRGCSGSSLPMTARVLAVADAYDALIHPRPHRPAATAEHAENALLIGVRKGEFDADAVRAVLTIAGHDAPVERPPTPAGLTPREVEVLQLVAGGRTNRQIAAELTISPRTAEQHVQNLYAKIGSSTRAAAALFAMEHLLVPPEDP
jgi:HD-GYP domain-containing protein (c-di-GMP phosphodiesterase class II)/DNA-binding CsgD family transcriptional regulator